MAYWGRPGETEIFCNEVKAGNNKQVINETWLSDNYIEKNIKIGYDGLENVIEFDSHYTTADKAASNIMFGTKRLNFH